MTSDFEIIPRGGIGPVQLGEHRDHLRATLAGLGLPLERANGTLDYFCDSTLQVEYGPTNLAEFIGVSGPPFRVTYHGIDVFDVASTALFEEIARRESGLHRYHRAQYIFPDQILALWDADEQYDYRGEHERAVWAQVGVGNEQYLAGMRAMGSCPGLIEPP